MNMLEQVIFLLEGEYDTGMMRVKDGLPYRRIAFQDVYWRWESDRLTATDCLAIIYFSICGIGTTDEAGVLDAWSAELRTAAETKEIRARNPVTLLPFNVLPDGWDWLVSIDDCDKLLKARGLDWQISTVVEHIAGLLFHMPTNEAAATSGTPEKTETPAARITTHRIETRSNILSPIIEMAKQAASSPGNYQSVWAELVKLADSAKRPAPLIGYSDGEGVKYQDSIGVKFFTKDALKKRMKRSGAIDP